MQESAQAALSWVRSHTDELGLPENWFAEHDVHIHVPAGAIPKDGPSAGVTMATAIASLVRAEPVSDEAGMTGEITLTGQVLPIGGLKEKSLAAQRAGIKQVIVPDRNEGDVEEISEQEREGLEFVYADDIGDALRAALEPDGKGRRSARGSKSAGNAVSG
jgi:ATP-dependent Lon protease